MRRGDVRVWVVVTMLASLIGLTAADAHAQDKGPNTGRVSLGMGVDFTTHYFFRGILPEGRQQR